MSQKVSATLFGILFIVFLTILFGSKLVVTVSAGHSAVGSLFGKVDAEPSTKDSTSLIL